MSHVTDVKFTVPEEHLDVLAEVAAEKGLALKLNQKTFNWFGQWVNDFRGNDAAVDNGYDPATFGTCEHALVQVGDPKGYGVGLVRSKSGKGFDLLYDAWNGGRGLHHLCGAGLSDLKQTYQVRVAAKKATAKLKKAGFVLLPEKKLANGVVRLTLRKL